MLIQHIDQFRECRRYKDTFFILDALQSLTKNLFDYHGIFFYIFIIFFQIQKQGHKRRLSVCGHQGIDLILNGLYAGAQFIMKPVIDKLFHQISRNPVFILFRIMLFILFPADSQIFAQMPDIHRLSAILTGCHC